MKEKINFEKGRGLIPAVIQDYVTKEVLMVGYMNPEALRLTIETGYVWFYSRKRKKLWKKGEQSGNLQKVEKVFLDCDNDTFLIEVNQTGGACDLGYKSCFNKILIDGDFIEIGEKVFNPVEVYPYSEDISFCLPTGSLAHMSYMIFEKIKTKCLKEMGEGIQEEYSWVDCSGKVNLYRNDPRKIPHHVEKGKYDCAITGKDCLLESGVDVTVLGDLNYNKLGTGTVFWVLAARSDLNCNNLRDFEGRKVKTKIPNIANKLFNACGVNAVVFTGEDNLQEDDGIDAVIEIAESGKTINDRGFKIIGTVLSTSAVFVGCNSSLGYTWKRKRIEKLYLMIQEASAMLPVNLKTILSPTSLWPSSEDNFTSLRALS
jgi:ATP phosphoribosyltransferase